MRASMTDAGHPPAELQARRDLAANTIRTLAMDAVQRADSGHPGMPMGMADAAVVLWTELLSFDSSDPTWPNRDRFVLSAGHGSMLLYSLLHLSGYDLPMEELKNFRQWGSRTPGHPENFLTPGVETSTGPLGQGISNAVGFALAERHLAARFNRPGYEVVDHYTYVIASDGDLMEGISGEASSLAGHWKLGKLIVLYDDNNISIDGSTDLAFTEDVGARYSAYGWHTQVVDGHDADAVLKAIEDARAETGRPSIIQCKTHIGYGSPNKQDTASAHGSPLGEEEIEKTKEALGWSHPKFFVPEDVYTFMQAAAERGAEAHAEWDDLMARYAEAYPKQAQAWADAHDRRLPDDLGDALPSFPAGGKSATRNASGKALDVLKPAVPWLIGGSADLTPSNKTIAKGDENLQFDNYDGRYIRFGVREHAMGAILNGLNLHGGIRAYGGTFLIFSDYMRNTVRLAALSHVPSIFVYTHDSIGLGEDGPTHQPIEQIPSLRAIPNLLVLRPADANETVAAWRVALEHTDRPSALLLTRQNVAHLDPDARDYYEAVQRGAYVVEDADDPQVLLLATGSEVEIAVAARALLADDGIRARVVSMPSWELFEAQDQAYRDSVLPPGVTARVAMEAAHPLGWERYVGTEGAVIGINRFGASAPYERIYEEYGLTPEAMADAARALVG